MAVFTARAESVICHHRRREKAARLQGQETSIPSPHPFLLSALIVMQAVTAAIVPTILCQQQGNQRHKMGDTIVPVEVFYPQQQCIQIKGRVLLRVFILVLAVGRATVELMEIKMVILGRMSPNSPIATV